MKQFNLKANAKTLNFNPQRRKSLKDLSLLSFASLALMNLHKERKQEEFLFSPNFESSLLQSNIPEKLLNLPLQSFHFPSSFEIILKEQRLRDKETQFIIPLMNFSNDLNLDVKANAFNKDFNFLTYHYENLNSLLKDLEQKNFYIRSFDLNHISFLMELLCFLIVDGKRNASAKDEIKEPKDFIDDKEFFSKAYKNIEIHHCTIYQLETTTDLYKEFRRRERRNRFKDDRTAPIRLYNEALAILEDYANDYFTNTLIEGKYIFDKRKARRLVKALDVIGQNNLKAMYVKNQQEKVKEKMQSLNVKQVAMQKTKIKFMKEVERELDEMDFKLEQGGAKIPPNFIGRLATTIIIEDGLYLG